MAVTFDGVGLKNPETFEIDKQVLVSDTVLLSGKHSIQSSAQTAISAKIKCYTDTKSDVTNLQAKIGTAGSLVIDSDTYTKCHISSFTSKEWALGEWEYTVEFIQDTT